MKILMHLMLLGITCSVLAQTPLNVSVGKVLNEKVPDHKHIVGASDGTSLYAIINPQNIKDIKLNQYDLNTLAYKATVEVPESDLKFYNIYSVIGVGNQVYAITRGYDKSSKSFLFEFRKLNGSKLDNNIALKVVWPKNVINYENVVLGIVSNSNDTKMLVFSDHFSDEERNLSKGDVLFEGTVINAADQSMETQTIKTQHSAYQTITTAYGLSDNGTIYLVAKGYKEKGRNDITAKQYLYIATPDGNVKMVELPKGERVLDDYKLIVEDNQVTVAGFYVDSEVNYNAIVTTGSFSVTVNTQSGNITQETFNNWTEADLKEADFDDTYIKKGVLKRFTLLDVVKTASGGHYIVGEFYENTVGKSIAYGAACQIKTNALIVIYADATGKEQ